METKQSKKKHHEIPNRILVLGEINEENTLDAMAMIHEINKMDFKLPQEQRDPIELYINSPGGHIYYGLGLVDCIEQSVTPVNTTVQGHAMSMALPILCVSHVRRMTRRSTLMYHSVAWETNYEKLNYHKQELKEGERLQKIYDNIILDRTKVTERMLKLAKTKSKEWYITPEKAKELGIVEEII
jgi:ATP-dependent Clp protease protease subunit